MKILKSLKFAVPLVFIGVTFFSLTACASLPKSGDQSNIEIGPTSLVIHIHNISEGKILGSKDGGSTWIDLGHVVTPVDGGVWVPAVDNGVLAFDYLRGPSNIFATAVNNIHIRFSDPEGYVLPEDVNIPPVHGRGISLSPAGAVPEYSNGHNRVIVTNIPGGTGLFGPEWSPKVGSQVLMGDGVNYLPISHEIGPDSNVPERSHILIITESAEKTIEYLELENKAEGKVLLKRAGEEIVQVGKVKKHLEGIGRFGGSEFVQKPGVIRANHAGVLCIGTTDINSDPNAPQNIPVEEKRGGFQIIPSHHFQDDSMMSGRDHAEVYLVVGPEVDPPNLKRYDMGLEGRYPLFNGGFHAGEGKTFFKFRGDEQWYELDDAIRIGKFKSKDGTVVKHLRGYVKDAMIEVTGIRLVVH